MRCRLDARAPQAVYDQHANDCRRKDLAQISNIGRCLSLKNPERKKAQQDGIPLYCGEYGVIDLADNMDKIRWLKDIHAVMNRHGIGRALWNYKEKDFGLTDERFSEIREQFIGIL